MSKGDARSLGRYHDDEELFSTDDVALPDPLEQEVRLVEGFDGSQTNTVAFFPDMSGHFLAKAYTATGGSKQVGSIFLRNPQQTEECVFELWQCSATLVVTKAERSPLSNSSSSKNNSKGSSSSSSSKGKLLSRQQELDFSFLPSISAILELYASRRGTIEVMAVESVSFSGFNVNLQVGQLRCITTGGGAAAKRMALLPAMPAGNLVSGFVASLTNACEALDIRSTSVVVVREAKVDVSTFRAVEALFPVFSAFSCLDGNDELSLPAQAGRAAAYHGKSRSDNFSQNTDLLYT